MPNFDIIDLEIRARRSEHKKAKSDFDDSIKTRHSFFKVESESNNEDLKKKVAEQAEYIAALEDLLEESNKPSGCCVIL